MIRALIGAALALNVIAASALVAGDRARPDTVPDPGAGLEQMWVPTVRGSGRGPCLPIENLMHLAGCPMVLV